MLLGVTGGVAAYKALELVRLATKAGHAVRVIQTPTSQRFVGAASFAALSGAPVLTEEFERDPARGAFPDQAPPEHDPLSHLELVRNADAFLIAPASANTIAKLAHGLADNLLTSAALAATCPVLVAPAMNNHMYEHPATQANLATLRELADRVGAGRRNQERVGVAHQLEVAEGVVVRRRLVGEGAARGVALELVGQDRGAAERGERRRADEALSRGGLDDPHGVTGLRGQPHQLQRLVGGDTASDAEEHATQRAS